MDHGAANHFVRGGMLRQISFKSRRISASAEVEGVAMVSEAYPRPIHSPTVTAGPVVRIRFPPAASPERTSPARLGAQAHKSGSWSSSWRPGSITWRRCPPIPFGSRCMCPVQRDLKEEPRGRINIRRSPKRCHRSAHARPSSTASCAAWAPTASLPRIKNAGLAILPGEPPGQAPDDSGPSAVGRLADLAEGSRAAF
jgi:hypothetical protein